MFEKKEDSISKKEHEKIVNELKSYINKKENELSETEKFKVLFDSKSNEIILNKNNYYYSNRVYSFLHTSFPTSALGLLLQIAIKAIV